MKKAISWTGKEALKEKKKERKRWSRRTIDACKANRKEGENVPLSGKRVMRKKAEKRKGSQKGRKHSESLEDDYLILRDTLSYQADRSGDSPERKNPRRA